MTDYSSCKRRMTKQQYAPKKTYIAWPHVLQISCKLIANMQNIFFRFPHRSPELLREWVIQMRRNDFTPVKKSVVCSDHFEEACFDRTGQTIRLRDKVIPTIFDFPLQLIKVFSLILTSPSDLSGPPMLALCPVWNCCGFWPYCNIFFVGILTGS